MLITRYSINRLCRTFIAHTNVFMRFFIKSAWLLLLLAAFFTNSYAQNYSVKGIVLDTAGQPLPGAVVRIKSNSDSIGISANTDGTFIIGKIKSKQFTLSAAFIGYDTFVKQYLIEKGNSLTIQNIKLKPSANTLDAVVISGVPPVKVTEDTVSFNAKAFPVREGDAVDEVLKKLPGVKVDKDGNVTSQGTPVTKIRVNGKDFFGTDVATAIKNLPADIIKNLQFIDDYGDQAKLTGIKTGEPEKILNLTIQEDKKKGYFARASAGLGNSDRYNTNLRGNSMKGERQLSFDATSANANMRGGGGDGVTTRNVAGLNYKNEFSPKLSVDGGYNFNNSQNNTISSTYTQNILQDAQNNPLTRLEDANSNNKSNNNSHWVGGNIEYKIDTMNYLKVSPNFNYSSGNGNSAGGSLTTQDTLFTRRQSNSANNTNNLSAKTNIFFNHKFEKKGRNLTAWGNINYSNNGNFANNYNKYVNTKGGAVDSLVQNQLNNQDSRNLGLNAGASYMEPLWSKTFIELNYNWNRSATNNSREAYDLVSGNQVFNPQLSNIYDYQFTTHKAGINYRYIGEKLNYTLGLNAQPVLLSGQNRTRDLKTENRTFNLIPSGRFSYKFSNQESLDINYWGRNNQPGFLQLQPISDNSNLQNIITGNPDLKPEFIQSINAHYKQADWSAGKIILANFRYERTNDKIVTTKQRVAGTVNQLTSYTNTDGYYTVQGDYNISKPFSAERKFTLGYSGSGQLNNNISFTDNNQISAKNISWRQQLEFRVDLKDIVNLQIETAYSQNLTSYSNSIADRQSNRFEYGIEGRNYFFKDLTLGYDFSKQVNSGFDNGAVRNPTLLRLSMEYKFMKNDMAALRVEGFDLFDQNSGISRDVFDNVIVDRQVNRLGRYFMLSLIYRVRKFG